MKNIPDFVTLAESGRVTVTLQDGLTVSGDTYNVAIVKHLTAGEILDAQEEAERLVYAKDGSMGLVMSPARMAREALRRQVAKLENTNGKHDGPLNAKELGQFSSEDLSRLQAATALLDFSTALAAEGVQSRGRTAAGSGTIAADNGSDSPQSGN